MTMTNLKSAAGVNLREVKEYFYQNYSHISFDWSDTKLIKYLNQSYVARVGNNMPIICDMLADHLLANDECDVQE